ncbi:hypothetical protein J1N35_040401, partial [Gossypium stocksii]
MEDGLTSYGPWMLVERKSRQKPRETRGVDGENKGSGSSGSIFNILFTKNKGPIKIKVRVNERLLHKEKHSAVIFKNNQCHNTKDLVFVNSDDSSRNTLTSSTNHENHRKTGNRRKMKNLSKTIRAPSNSFKVSNDPRVSLVESVNSMVEFILTQFTTPNGKGQQ